MDWLMPATRRSSVGVRGEVGQQLFLAGDRVEHVVRSVSSGRYREPVRFETARVDPIADARRLEGAVAKNTGQAGRVSRRGLDLRGFHDHDDVLELAEVLGVVLVERGVLLMERQQMELGRLEREGMCRVTGAERGTGERHGDRQRWVGAAKPDEGL